MKRLIIAILSLISTAISAQDIQFLYIDDKQVLSDPIPIERTTTRLSITDVVELKTFRLRVKNLPQGLTLIVKDKVGTKKSIKSDGETEYTTHIDLNNTQITLFVEENGEVSIFTSFLVQNLPVSSLDIMTDVSFLKTPDDLCKPCDLEGSHIIYDYSRNEISEHKKPKVNRPFTFLVTNLNPFRDSIVVSEQAVSFNTDVPALFNQAYLSTMLQGKKDDNIDMLLADVFALGRQLNTAETMLRTARACDDICADIEKIKKNIEEHFKTKYCADESSIENCILTKIKGIPDVYQDSALAILQEYRNFTLMRSYFQYNIPAVRNVDEYTFTLSILPKKSAVSHTRVDRQPISVYTVGGIKFDFSSGLFVTGLRDERFHLRPDSSVIKNSYGGDSLVFNRSNRIVRLSSERKVDFGVTALMHIYPRISPYVNVGASIGAGLSIGPNPSIRYLGGVSLLVGRSGRLGISFGWAAGFVETLADSYYDQQFVSLKDTDALTKKTFKTKGFCAVTFSIPLFQSQAVVNPLAAATNTSKSATKSKTESDKETKTGTDSGQ